MKRADAEYTPLGLGHVLHISSSMAKVCPSKVTPSQIIEAMQSTVKLSFMYNVAYGEEKATTAGYLPRSAMVKSDTRNVVPERKCPANLEDQSTFEKLDHVINGGAHEM